MSFIEYYRSTLLVPLKNITQECVSLIVPINSDSFLLLQTNNKYQVHRILSGEMIYSGEIPKGFVASQFIETLSTVREDCVFFTNSEGGICRLEYKENKAQVREMVMPEKPDKLTTISVEYRLLGEMADYLVGWVKNIQNMSCNFFVYDWISRTFSNSLYLGSNFFDLVISNLSHNLDSESVNTKAMKLPAINFVIAAESQKKIWYNYVQLQAKTQDKQQKKADRVEFMLRESGKKNMTYDHCPKVVHLQYPYVYMVTNNKEGPFLLQVNLQQNSKRRLQIHSSSQKLKGLVRRYLGMVDNNILFIVHNILSRIQEIYCLPVSTLLNLNSNIGKVGVIKLIRVENEKNYGYTSKSANIYKCIEGFSFHRYSFELEKAAKLIMEEHPEFIPNLIVETIYRIPKKYYYSEMAEQLNFSCALTHEILNLL